MSGNNNVNLQGSVNPRVNQNNPNGTGLNSLQGRIPTVNNVATRMSAEEAKNHTNKGTDGGFFNFLYQITGVSQSNLKDLRSRNITITGMFHSIMSAINNCFHPILLRSSRRRSLDRCSALSNYSDFFIYSCFYCFGRKINRASTFGWFIDYYRRCYAFY